MLVCTLGMNNKQKYFDFTSEFVFNKYQCSQLAFHIEFKTNKIQGGVGALGELYFSHSHYSNCTISVIPYSPLSRECLDGTKGSGGSCGGV